MKYLFLIGIVVLLVGCTYCPSNTFLTKETICKNECLNRFNETSESNYIDGFSGKVICTCQTVEIYTNGGICVK